MAEHIDVLVMGGGTAGNAASRALAAEGLSVVVAEPGKMGGTCVWNGCMPKKALFNAARTYREMLSAEKFGILPGEVSVDWPGVLAWKWHAQETYAGDQEGIMQSHDIRHISAPARFISPTRMIAGDGEFEPAHVVVATGSRAFIPPIPGADLADISDHALHYPHTPDSLVIVGGGYVAMEFAGIYASLGTKVTILARSTILPSFDPDTVAIAVTALEELGVIFVHHATTTSISGFEGDFTVYFEVSGQSRSVAAEHVLMATGRVPDLENLGLDVAGIERDTHGRPVLDSALRSSNPRVYFAGDATGLAMHTPLANLHGHRVAGSILTGEPHDVDASAMPFACFTVPELAQVGLTEHEAAERGISYRIVSGTPEYVGAAIITDHRTGLLKVIVAGDGTVLGAHMAGHGASDLIYTYALAVQVGATIEQIAATRAIHPSMAEWINWTTR